MAYGENMRRLSPCEDGFIAGLIPGLESVLDVGCGRGDRLRTLRGLGKRRLCGAEPDPENAAAARAACPEAEISGCAAEALDWPSGSFDAVLCECTLSLTERPEAAMGEMARVLRPGGRLILADLCAGEHCESGAGDATGRIFTPAEAEALLTGAGLTVEERIDRSGDLLAMAAQMILDGELCSCMSVKTLAELKRVRAGYRVWAARKPRISCRTAAVIPAAGLSSRMGDFKPLLPFGTGTVLTSCADALRRGGAEAVVIVTGRRARDLEAAVTDAVFVHNPDFAETEMFDSLCLGLSALAEGCERVLVSPGDVPAVSAETVRAVLDAPGAAVRPLCAGRPGHPLALDGTLIPRLLAYGGAGGLRGALEALDVPLADVETGDRGAVLDADTPEEYRALRAMKENQ